MSELHNVKVNISQPTIRAVTLPAGTQGRGIKNIKQYENILAVTYDDGEIQEFFLPDWWFGTRTEYNNLSEDNKKSKSLYFIEEGT